MGSAEGFGLTVRDVGLSSVSDFEALNSTRESVDMASFAGSCQGCLEITLYAHALFMHQYC